MARSEARLKFSVWDGLDGHGPHAKLLYPVLLTEPTVNFAGVGAIRVTRWARKASLTAAETQKALAALVDSFHIVVDEDTEEVLVRTMIRNDEVWKQPFLLKGALQEALMTVSPRLRWVLAEELRKLPPKQPDGVSKSGKTIVYPDPHATADVLAPPGSEPPPETLSKGSPDPLDTLSEGSPEAPSRRGSRDPLERQRGRGGGRGRGEVPVGENLSFDQNLRAKNSKTELAVVPDPTTAQQAVAAWHDAYVQHHDANPTRRQIGQAAREAKALLDAGNPPPRVVRAATSAGARGFATLEREYRDLSSRGAPAPARPRPSTTDQRVAQGLALAAKYEALEALEENQ